MKLLKGMLLGMLLVLFMVAVNPAQDMGNGSISGMVLSQADSTPLARAKVFAFRFQNLGMPKKFYAETDEKGFYKIDNLSQGDYWIYAQRDSFVAEFYKDTNNPFFAIPIKVDKGAAIKGIDFYLENGGIITGRVTDRNGAGIPKVQISATPFQSIMPQPIWVDSLLVWGATQTNDDGYYEINTLDSNQYRVSAKLISPIAPFFQIKYYDNKTNPMDADPVLVDNGQQKSGIDFKFDYVLPTGGITGTAKDADGNPLEGVFVFAWQKTDGDTFSGYFRGFGNQVRTDKNGNYAINHLSPGDYIVSATRIDQLNFQTIYYDGAAKIEDATPVKVADAIVPNINFVFDKLANPGSISGKVTLDSDGSPVANAFVEAMWIGSYAGHGHAAVRPSMFSWTDEKGNYKIEKLRAGKYIVLVHKNGYTEFYDDTQDITKATEVEVLEGKETSGINFGIPALPDTGSKVSGVVKDDSTGDPIEGAIVTLFPVTTSPHGNAFKGKFTLFDFYATVSDRKGEYLIAGIPAGKYIAVCWASKYIVEFYDNKMTPWDADQIELDGATDRNDINFALTPGWGFRLPAGANDQPVGMISGQITDNEGRYVAGAYVSVIDENYQLRGTEMTGADGTYILAGIPAGKYFVKVDRMPYKTAYYGNTTDLNQATPVAVGEAGNFTVTSVDVALTPMATTDVEQSTNSDTAPKEFELAQNYPNPFNPTTTIRYALPVGSHVTLKIYNLKGEVVKTLVNGYQAAQNHQVVWNGDNDAGQRVAAGIYLYQLQAGNYRKTMRLILMK
ncbi:MAG: carboxypeptidase regulatory-like domain-containing protein [candidate division KSB1 bacterium]|nr:carboxypeptidase regulatory-like domain-containing protein [candidate division KSB1 bacterium]MDZ7336779.1 carboxypeptidase regulatory-like domain-containing protein [candidate division KSB1 bacterium]MDZ7358556.1 carboxypeptidase regulatory-like domain-containing protein [candidate division KSB1 bacterium]MDZ7375316.1 carboxypeptidase regulatory-like domain-containing protein [candidate division KSB1 bacterium]MDZ7401646.1 carboxypeptidase regulatory-like domain-containing protein [candidat